MQDVTEAELQSAAVAPRVTEDGIKAQIAYICYFNAATAVRKGGRWETGAPDQEVDVTALLRALDVTTYCVIVTRTGFTVTGQSACASPENYNQAIGERLAYKDAFGKLWALEGYLLKAQIAGRVHAFDPGDPGYSAGIDEAVRQVNEFAGQTGARFVNAGLNTVCLSEETQRKAAQYMADMAAPSYETLVTVNPADIYRGGPEIVTAASASGRDFPAPHDKNGSAA